MAQPQYPPPASERWNVNLPAVIGVVFVFLVGVIIWVIAASGGDNDDDTDLVSESTSSVASTSVASTSLAPDTTTTTTPPTTSIVAPATVPGTTTPAPMPPPTATTNPPVTTPPAPATSARPTTIATTTAPAPPTTAPGADPDSVPGDLGIPGYAMQAPPCNDSFITIIASAVGDDVAAAGVEAYLDDYPTSNYLRTDRTCPSLAQDIDGEPIYVVYFGPFPFAADACEARADGTEGSYARTLSETDPPNHTINCPTP